MVSPVVLECKSAMKSAEMLALNGRIWGKSANPLDIDTFAVKSALINSARESAGVAPLERSGAAQRDGPTALPTSQVALGVSPRWFSVRHGQGENASRYLPLAAKARHHLASYLLVGPGRCRYLPHRPGHHGGYARGSVAGFASVPPGGTLPQSWRVARGEYGSRL